MNTSGEAADQVVRMALQTGEVALKITGEGAKQLAVLLYAILKEQKKSKGKARMETLVRTGKPLTVYSVKESDIKEFVKEAKRYGVLYCAVRNPRRSKDGMVDVIVKQEDASRINRIIKRFRLASVSEVAQIKSEIVQSRAEKGKMSSDQKKTMQAQPEPERGTPEKADADKLVDELLGAPVHKEGEKTENPFPAKTEKSHLSEPISGRQNRAAEGTSKSVDTRNGGKPSVRQELKEIQEQRKEHGDRTGSEKNRTEHEGTETSGKSGKNRQKTVRHKQPVQKKRLRGKAR